MNLYKRKSKGYKCPNCNSKLVDIIYGYPVGQDMKELESKEIYLGGCTKSFDKKQLIYHCYECNRSYFKGLKKYVETKDVFWD